MLAAATALMLHFGPVQRWLPGRTFAAPLAAMDTRRITQGPGCVVLMAQLPSLL